MNHANASLSQGAILRLIAAQPFAQDLDEAMLERLRETATHHWLEKNDFLFHQEEHAARFFMVTQGRLKLYRASIDGEEKVVNQVGPGGSFAEGIAFMETPRYPVYAQALETSHLIGLSRDIYRSQLLASPETCLAVMGHMTVRIRHLLKEIESLALYDSRDRVIRFLLGLLPDDEKAETEHTITLPGPKGTIASQLSIRAETLSRVLGELSDSGLIQRTQEAKRIHVPDTRRLWQALNSPENDRF